MLGHRAYAEKQAATLLALARDSASLWLPSLANEGIVPEWANHYNIAENSEANSSLTSHNTAADDPENLDDTEELDGEDDVCSVVSSLDTDFDTYNLDL
jgi:hypothetical protein